MAPSEHPDTPPERSAAPATTGIQTSSENSAPAEAPSITLPPLPQPPAMDPAKFLRLRGGLDTALVVVVLLFAFLVASFPVINSDFFRQLATARLLLQGEYHFGVDPFVYSPADSDYFVNHSWLFALMMYGLYHLPAIGGAAIVIFKALLVVGVAECLLRAGRRPGQSLWIPAACTALAILVVSPRLYLQSTCLSFLFLGVTLWLLTAMRRNGKRFWWLLPPLFALWVNCDSWFFLGPLTVALYLLGELGGMRLSANGAKPQANCQRELRTLGLVFLSGLAACLLNPHHVHAFTLPPEFGLTPAGDLIAHEPQFRSLFLSPLRKDFYEPYLGLSVAGLAYWLLMLLALASFVLVLGRAPWRRLLVWMGFVLLSFYNCASHPLLRHRDRPHHVLELAGLRSPTPRSRAASDHGMAQLVAGRARRDAPAWPDAPPRHGTRLAAMSTVGSTADRLERSRRSLPQGDGPDDPRMARGRLARRSRSALVQHAL